MEQFLASQAVFPLFNNVIQTPMRIYQTPLLPDPYPAMYASYYYQNNGFFPSNI